MGSRGWWAQASSAYNGVGIVKLMGRQSGYIAMHAALACGQVDVVLIPEVPFEVEGEGGVLEFVEERVLANGNCLIVLAEGAGQVGLPPRERVTQGVETE